MLLRPFQHTRRLVVFSPGLTENGQADEEVLECQLVVEGVSVLASRGDVVQSAEGQGGQTEEEQVVGVKFSPHQPRRYSGTLEATLS